MATHPRQSERGPSDHINQETRKAGEQVAQTMRTVSDAVERTNRVGAETLQRNTEQAKETWQEANEAVGRIAQRSMEQLSKMFGLGGETTREAFQQSSGNLQAVMESTTVIASGLHEVTEDWMRFAQERVEHNLNHLDKLRNCRSLHDCVALQTQMVRDNLQAFLDSAQRTSERSTRIARAAADRRSNASGCRIGNI
jgi:hypothetical protein